MDGAQSFAAPLVASHGQVPGGSALRKRRRRGISDSTWLNKIAIAAPLGVLDLAPLELDCMNTLWPIGEGTVREIRDRLAARLPRAYTTIMTIMDRLARKGVVERSQGRPRIRLPAAAERGRSSRASAGASP